MGYCLGKNLWSLSRVGISFHISFSVNDVRSGPRPHCLDSRHVLFQSVFGLSVTHFRGFSGQSETGDTFSPAGVTGLVFRTVIIRSRILV